MNTTAWFLIETWNHFERNWASLITSQCFAYARVFLAAFADDESIFKTTGMKRAGYWLMRQINGRATNVAKRNMFALRVVSLVLI
jgi:hypothetical protein